MTKNEILGFLNANPVFHLATVEAKRPHVRGMLLYRADENGLIFHTGKMKDIHRQLTEDPEDLELKKEIVQKREFLKAWVDQNGYEPLAVYRIRKGVSTVWTMKTNLAPKEFIEL